MFCPQCRVEYRPGFTRCTDCDLVLVDSLTEEPKRAGEANKIIWMGEDQERCIALCQHLKDAGAPYQVTQRMKSSSTGRTYAKKDALAVPAEEEDSEEVLR